MYEDDTYRSSSQFRLWSFTRQQLQERRQETNRLAAEKVRASFRRARLAGGLALPTNGLEDVPGSSAPASNTATPEPIPKPEVEGDVVPLTADEELRMLQWGCEKILELKDVLEITDDRRMVLCTAIQYLRRFYMSNSPMSYHPKQILTCAIWLAYKADHMPQDALQAIGHFVAKLDKTTEDDVRAPEFLLMQSLRFTLDVKHPMRGLDGCASDMKRLADTDQLLVENDKGRQLKRRIDKAHQAAKTLCMKDVQMTDAYFLYTPPQIQLACLLIADKVLTMCYVDALFEQLGTKIGPIKQKLKDAINACADMIHSYRSFADDSGMRRELAKIGKKLRKCQDPEKSDIVSNERAKIEKGYKRGEDSDDDRNVKKRKKEEDGEVFGPGLGHVSANGKQRNGD